MTLNIGPQHPATHGTLRIVAKPRRRAGRSPAEPVAGYMHRGYEKLTEVRTYPQVTTLVNRIDWLGQLRQRGAVHPRRREAHGGRGAAAGPVDPHDPLRAVPHRQRHAVPRRHGAPARRASPPVFYAFRDREYVLNQIEAVTGGRFHPNFDRIGGLKDDLPKGWIAETKAAMERIRAFCDEMEDALVGNEIFQARTRGHRGHPRRRRPVLRAVGRQPAGVSGVDWDLRRDAARRAWPATRSTGRSGPTPTATASPASGCACRRSARPPRSSTSSSTACPSGPIMAKVPRIIKVPEGEACVATENPLGEMGYYVVSKGDLGPFRVKIRSAQLQQHLDRARGCCGASTSPTSSRSSPASTSSSGTSTGDGSVARRSLSSCPTGSRRSCASSACCVAVLLPAGTLVYLFLFKMMSFMQSRLGPMEAGPYGSMQLLAEVGKFLQKEDIVPERRRSAGSAGAIR